MSDKKGIHQMLRSKADFFYSFTIEFVLFLLWYFIHRFIDERNNENENNEMIMRNRCAFFSVKKEDKRKYRCFVVNFQIFFLDFFIFIENFIFKVKIKGISSVSKAEYLKNC